MSEPVAAPAGGTPAAMLPDPSARLEAAFRAVHVARMRDLPLANPALRVQSVGFAPWEGHWLGVLVTPWCMNLVLAPRDPSLWRTLEPGTKRRYGFPAGEYEFIGARDDVAGEIQSCSLFSPVQEFADHETACLTARFALDALLDPANAERPERAPEAESRRAPLRELGERLRAPVSRSDLFHGRLPRADDDRG